MSGKSSSTATRRKSPRDPKKPAGARRRAKRPPRNRRELAKDIFVARDPVDVGRELLNAESESVKARAFETFADWYYGPAGSGGTNGGVRIVWDLPAPPHESR
jgi:hypothetical protein